MHAPTAQGSSQSPLSTKMTLARSPLSSGLRPQLTSSQVATQFRLDAVSFATTTLLRCDGLPPTTSSPQYGRLFRRHRQRCPIHHHHLPGVDMVTVAEKARVGGGLILKRETFLTNGSSRIEQRFSLLHASVHGTAALFKIYDSVSGMPAPSQDCQFLASTLRPPTFYP